MRIIIATTVVSFAVLFFGTGFYLDQYIPKNKYEGMPGVVGLPEDYRESDSEGPYRGRHPSLQRRPQDPFKYPIKIGGVGPIESYFAGPLQYPFLCRTLESKLGQSLVDNQDRAGIPIYAENKNGELLEEIVGYSKDCSLPTMAWYYYNKKGTEKFYLLDETVKPKEIAKIEVNEQEVDFIVRVEAGTINRFIYIIAALSSSEFDLAQADTQYWNGRLVYQFRGGVGVGRSQGRASPAGLLRRRFEELKNGYAVAYSSGNQTSNHYNPWLAEETAIRVKNQFSALYGKPEFTIGVGGSGGAVQQYLIAQNNPEVLDAIIPLYSYGDMITQTTYVLDCELLEYYFDVTDGQNPIWKNWSNRRWIEGMNSLSKGENKFSRLRALAQIASGKWPSLDTGISECVNGWRGLTPLVLNPKFYHHGYRYSEEVFQAVNWTHWQDLKHFYGVDEAGYARTTWDNTGVQYGLDALKAGFLAPPQFISLNAKIGSWKDSAEFLQERFWFLDKSSDAAGFSPWSHHNMNLAGSISQPAKRKQGDIEAMQGAYRAGIVFLGNVDLPVLDIRHYLEDEVDMHHLQASFAVRQRMARFNGHTDNHVMWVTRKPHNPVPEALELLDQWLTNIKINRDGDVVANKPNGLTDQCMDEQGDVIAAGSDVWDGGWNNNSDGPCMKIYPSYSTPRMVAGDGGRGDVFKCQLQSIEQAVSKGIYGRIDMSDHMDELKQAFPDGVCDYSKPDMGIPSEILALYDSAANGEVQLASNDSNEDWQDSGQ